MYFHSDSPLYKGIITPLYDRGYNLLAAWGLALRWAKQVHGGPAVSISACPSHAGVCHML